MLSGCPGFRHSRIILFVALLAGATLAPGSVNAQSSSVIGDPNIYLKPYPAPVLPPAGGSFVDPTFGTTIPRDRATNAPRARA